MTADRRCLTALLCVIAAFLLVPASAGATAYRFTGQGTDHQSWDDPANWSPQAVPGAGDDVTIKQNPGGPAPAVLHHAVTVRSVDLEAGGSITGQSITMTGGLTWLGGTIDTSLTLPAGSTSTVSGTAPKNLGDGTQGGIANAGSLDIGGPGVVSIWDPANLTNSGHLTLEPGSAVHGVACCVHPSYLISTGTLTVPGPGTANLLALGFEASGSVVLSGSGELDVGAAPVKLDDGVAVSGAGRIKLSGSQNAVPSGTVGFGAGTTLELAASSDLAGTATIGGGGTLDWTGGQIDGAITIASGTRLLVEGSATKTLASDAVGPGRADGQRHQHHRGSGPALAGLRDPDERRDDDPRGRRAGSRIGVLRDAAEGAEQRHPDRRRRQRDGHHQPAGLHQLGHARRPLRDARDQHHRPGPDERDDAPRRRDAQLGGDWTGGQIDGAITVASGTRLLVEGSATKTLASDAVGPGRLTANGTSTIAGPGVLSMAYGTLTNGGTMTLGAGALIRGSACCVTPPKVQNNGTLIGDAGTGTATINLLAFTNSGTLDAHSGTLEIDTIDPVQTKGTTLLDGGTLGSDHTLQLKKGKLVGVGTIAAAVANTGASVLPGPLAPKNAPGVLRITRTYSQSGKGSFKADVTGAAPGTGYDQLAVGGAVTLGGTLAIKTKKTFHPAAGSHVSVVTALSRTGTFATVTGTAIPAGGTWTVAYLATGVDLVAGP